MDLRTVIERVETAEQGAALAALRSYNTEMNQCFTFSREEERDRQHLGELVLDFLKRDLQPSHQLTCLETVRILSRDQHCQGPFVSRSAMSTLARCAGFTGAAVSAESPALVGDHQLLSVSVTRPAASTVAPAALSAHSAEDGEGDVSGEVVNEALPPSENLHQEAVVEALKSICNIVLHNEAGQAAAAELHLIKAVAARLKQCHNPTWSHEVWFFDLRLTFQLTALRVDVRAELTQELRGMTLLGNHLDATLGLCWTDTLETARAGSEVIPPEELPPLTPQQIELAMEILKILFNITFDARQTLDEEEAAEYRHLGAILRHCLMSHGDEEEQTEKFHSHTVNLLGNFPAACLDVLLMPKVNQGSIEYMGVNMNAVNMLLLFMERRLDQGHKLKETLLPSLNLLTEIARIHRETRKFLRSKVLPPLRDVKNRPEVGDALRNKLVRLMTYIDTDVKDCAAEFLFVLCKQSVSRFIKYTGYGNAAGLLAARGLLGVNKDSGIYSEEDSETEEYKEAKAQINPITGAVEEEQPDPMEGMTEEQKEYEAMKLVDMFDRLSRTNVIQPMKIGADGTMRGMSPEELLRQSRGPEAEPEEAADPQAADEA